MQTNTAVTIADTNQTLNQKGTTSTRGTSGKPATQGSRT